LETRVDESLRGSREASFGVDEGFGMGNRVERLIHQHFNTKDLGYLDVESVCAVCTHKNLHRSV